VWTYRPSEHKTEHHGHDRVIFIGPKAQQVLMPFLLRPAEEYCFSPVEADQDRRALRSERRVTPLSCGNRCGTNRKESPRKKPGSHYTTQSYGRAICQACRVAFPPQGELARREGETRMEYKGRLTAEQKVSLKAWYRQHHWHPHQLRHNYATYVRKQFGLEAAQVLLGHSKADVTQIYAERDMDRATQVAAKIG
jgi:integrase